MKMKYVYKTFKGTVSVISIDPSCEDGIDRFTRIPLKTYNVEDIVVFLGLRVLNSDNNVILQLKCASHFCKQTTIEIDQFLNL